MTSGPLTPAMVLFVQLRVHKLNIYNDIAKDAATVDDENYLRVHVLQRDITAPIQISHRYSNRGTAE